MTPSHPLSFTFVPDLKLIEAAFPGTKSLCFDMDGTLFDTEKYHAEALIQIGREHQIRPPFSPQELHDLMVGRADHLVYDIAKAWPGFPKNWTVKDFVEAKNRHLLRILKESDSNKYFPEATKKLLIEARTKGIKMALVTSSERVITEELLKLANLERSFDVVLTRDDCPQHKPDPWPYLRAMEILKCDPIETVILEDSSVGLQAALASRAHVIKVEWFRASE